MIDRVEMVGYRCVFSIDDIVSVFFKAVIECSVGFPNIHFVAQVAGYQVNNILTLAVEAGFDVECFVGWALE